MEFDLLVVIPVYNEERCLDGVLREWSSELDRSGIDYRILLLDDGSSDGTPAIIERWVHGSAGGRIQSKRHENIGHGQTCLLGYRHACWSGAPWVFQIDSDGQCDPSYFSALWAERGKCDVVYGCRTVRRDGWKRRLSSALVRLVVRVASGASCVDANVPYRLMSTTKLLPLVDSIPAQFDLANIALAVQIKRAGGRETSVPIIFRARAGGEPSVPLMRFAGKAVELFGQLLLLPCPVLRESA
jgi:dolichol-phosphate mannosyltransferase